ncbi:hypothetical protein [Arthrobacter caoxuetaonis]|uniref:Uncharacterized protein n=1 Tax=Arthrobacter caoxuetaonis TaxID=2886935 RepID=A0A9X1SDS1_9MICC|nr:hypothetical protein [Arthrobacter caoxuetaonis]MCC3299488.1 hypothetical protein [Arthrobacter caoxuetaonis]USQ59020.1 hypothetical protein NF551_18110 [Arthrobacter caoxuetaonis]
MPPALPALTHTRPLVADEPISAAAAARLAGISRHAVDKLVSAGYLRLVRPDVEALLRRPFVAAGGALPVIQTDAAQRDGTWRPYAGDSVTLSDADWLLAQSGDWTGVNSKAVVDTGYLLVGLGGVVTGAVRVHGRAPGAPAGKVRWKLSLIGRLEGTLKEDRIRFGAETTPDEEKFVLDTAGMRYPAKRGGAFTWI